MKEQQLWTIPRAELQKQIQNITPEYPKLATPIGISGHKSELSKISLDLFVPFLFGQKIGRA